MAKGIFLFVAVVLGVLALVAMAFGVPPSFVCICIFGGIVLFLGRIIGLC